MTLYAITLIRNDPKTDTISTMNDAISPNKE